MTALSRLAGTVAAAEAEVPFVHVGGRVSEVAPGHYRVRGSPPSPSSATACASTTARRSTICEVVRVGEADATVKPFVDALSRSAPAWSPG